MKRQEIITLIGIVAVISITLILIINVTLKTHVETQTESISATTVASTIIADGSITSQNEATLSFQTGGKLTYLPVKEGDTVTQGQTIASLDTYTLQRQLSVALNNYKSTRDAFDQTQENSQNGAPQVSNTLPLNPFNPLVLGGASISTQGNTGYNIMNDIAKRILDQSQAGLNNSVAQVEIANYALQLATLTSPINGIVTREDVTVPNVNVTPATTFVVDDPNSLVFRAQVNEQDIDYVSEGSSAVIHLDGNPKSYAGTVVKIYPQKMTLPSGQQIYQADIQATDDLKNIAKFDQGGSIEIDSNAAANLELVPTWTVLNGQYLWVDENGQKLLKQVTVGKTHDGQTEILGGLNSDDKVIINPESIIEGKYTLL